MSESPSPVALLDAFEVGGDGPDLKSCCAGLYESPAVRWLLGGELHPGGERTTWRTAELAGIAPGERVLDVASGDGTTAMLLARELGCEVVGVDYGAAAVEDASRRAAEDGLERRVEFVRGDAEALPFGEREFDAALCECSLSTFRGKTRALAEIRRVLRPGGTLGISDVVASRLPPPLRAAAAQVACVGGALTVPGYERALGCVGFELLTCEERRSELRRMVETLETRLRATRILADPSFAAIGDRLDEALELTALARRAIDEGRLSYWILSARAGSPRSENGTIPQS